MLSIPILIHIGVPKSGTSSLQENIFLNSPNILYAGRPHASTGAYFEFHTALMQNQRRDEARAIVRGYLLSLLEDAAQKNKKRIIISDENLSTCPFIEELAERLHFPDLNIKFLITTREQVSAIKSYYANHGRILKGVPKVAEGAYISFEDWWDYHKHKLDRGVFNSYHYGLLYTCLSAKHPTTVLTFEEMVTLNDRFCTELAEVTGETKEKIRTLMSAKPKNARDPQGSIIAQKVNTSVPLWKNIKKFIPFRRFFVGQLMKIPPFNRAYNPTMNLEAISEIQAHYQGDNLTLSELTGIDFAALGYATKKD